MMMIIALGWIGICISLLVLVIRNQIDLNRRQKKLDDWNKRHKG